MKAVIIERFNRSLRELMMKEFVKNSNTVWYNILPKLMNFYNNRYHNTIKDKPSNINKLNKKYIKNTIYKYNITNKIPKFKINDIVRISLKRRELRECFIPGHPRYMAFLKSINLAILSGPLYHSMAHLYQHSTNSY